MQSTRERLWRVLWIPADSRESEEERRPAESRKMISPKGKERWPSMRSRVVPGRGETRARLSFRNLLNREDFPEFGCPAKRTLNP